MKQSFHLQLILFKLAIFLTEAKFFQEASPMHSN